MWAGHVPEFQGPALLLWQPPLPASSHSLKALGPEVTTAPDDTISGPSKTPYQLLPSSSPTPGASLACTAAAETHRWRV